MKKIFLFATLITLMFLLCSCGNDNDDTNNSDYQRGYNAGIEDGRNQTSPTCNNSTQNEDQLQQQIAAKINHLTPILAKYFAPYNSAIEGNIQLITDSIMLVLVIKPLPED